MSFEYDSDLDQRLNLERLRSLRSNVNWQNEKERDEFFWLLYDLASDWQGQLPDLRDVLSEEEVDWLLAESRNNKMLECYDRREEFVKLLARSAAGYRQDEPEVDKEDDFEPIWLSRDTSCYTDDDEAAGQLRAHSCHVARRNFFEPAETKDSQLYLALEHEDEESIESLLRSGADPNSTDAEGSTPLHVISKKGYREDLARLLFDTCHEIGQQHVHVDARDKLGRTPLHLALVHDRCRGGGMVELLLRRGADPNASDAEGSTPLHVVYDGGKRNDRQLAEMLFDQLGSSEHRPLRIDARNEWGNAPLHLALERGNERLVELLLRRGADPNLANGAGSTPLHFVCNDRGASRGQLVRTFFEICEEQARELRLDARQDKLGWTPLHLALFCRHGAAVRGLLSRGADPNLANEEGLAPLHICLMNDDDDRDDDERESLTKLFFEINDERHRLVEVDARDPLGRTPLQLAVANLKPDVVDLLLNHGADLSSFVFPAYLKFNKPRRLALHELRILSGALCIVQRLEARGYEPDRGDAMTIVKFFAERESCENPAGDIENGRGHDDEEFVRRAKEQMVQPDLSLYDLIRLRPREAARRLTFEDYFGIFSEELKHFPNELGKMCASRLREQLLIGFMRPWVLDSFHEIIRGRLPLECCEMIVERLTSKDFFNICMAATSRCT